MKRGRPRKNKLDDESEEERPVLAKKASESDREMYRKIPKKIKKEWEEKSPKSKKERKFEILPLKINDVYDYIIQGMEKDKGLKAIIKTAYFHYRDLQSDISRRRNTLLRSNLPEGTYREEMSKLRLDERSSMDELYQQTIENLSAARIRGFESLETLKKMYCSQASSPQSTVATLRSENTPKESPKNLIAELLRKKPENCEEIKIEITSEIEAQLKKRRCEQQEVILKLFKTKIDFPDDDIYPEPNMERTKSLTLRKTKSLAQDLQFEPNLSRTPSMLAMEAKAEIKNYEKVSINDVIGGEAAVTSIFFSKLPDIKKSLDSYYEACQNPTSFENLSETTMVHPCLKQFEENKISHFKELERSAGKPDDLSYDDLFFLIYLTEECTNKMNQIRVARATESSSMDISPSDLRKYLERLSSR